MAALRSLRSLDRKDTARALVQVTRAFEAARQQGRPPLSGWPQGSGDGAAVSLEVGAEIVGRLGADDATVPAPEWWGRAFDWLAEELSLTLHGGGKAVRTEQRQEALDRMGNRGGLLPHQYDPYPGGETDLWSSLSGIVVGDALAATRRARSFSHVRIPSNVARTLPPAQTRVALSVFSCPTPPSPAGGDQDIITIGVRRGNRLEVVAAFRAFWNRIGLPRPPAGGGNSGLYALAAFLSEFGEPLDIPMTRSLYTFWDDRSTDHLIVLGSIPNQNHAGMNGWRRTLWLAEGAGEGDASIMGSFYGIDRLYGPTTYPLALGFSLAAMRYAFALEAEGYDVKGSIPLMSEYSREHVTEPGEPLKYTFNMW